MNPINNGMREWLGVEAKILYVLALITLLMHPASAEVISFGSTVDIKQLTIMPGEQKAFKVSFFNMGPDAIQVDFLGRYVSDLRVEITPAPLTLPTGRTTNPTSEPGKEWFVLSDGRTYVETKPVYVYVRVPSELTSNTYKVTLIATAKATGRSASTGFSQKMYQTREITFDIYSPGEVSRSREPQYYIESNGTSRTVLGPYRPESSSTPSKGGVVYGTPSGGDQGFTTGGYSGGGGGQDSGGDSGAGNVEGWQTTPPKTTRSQTNSASSEEALNNINYLASDENRPEVFGQTESETGAGVSSFIGNALSYLDSNEISGLGIIPLLAIIAFLARKLSKEQNNVQ